MAPLALSHFVDGSTISRWLDRFSAGTSDKRYARIEYAVWRKLKQFTNYEKIYVGFVSKDNELVIHFQDLDARSDIKHLEYDLPYQSEFSRFLIQEIFPKWGYATHVAKADSDGIAPIADFCTPYTMPGDKNKDMEKFGDYSAANLKALYIGPDPDTLNLNNSYGSDATWATTGSVSDNYMAVDTANSTIYTIKDTVDNIVNDFINEIKIDNTEKETSTMYYGNPENRIDTPHANDFFNFDFGPVNGNDIRMSMYGYAIRNEGGKYVSYDADNDRIMDVQILNFNGSGLFYKVPKALSAISEGDVVFHNNVPVFVTNVDDNRLDVIDPKDGTQKTILPAHSPFGFDYVTTLISIVDSFAGEKEADAENPFGKMLPFVLMGDANLSENMLPLMLMANGKMDFSNPLMLMMLCGGQSGFNANNPLMMMALMNGFNK